MKENKRYAGNEGWTVSECAAKVGGGSGTCTSGCSQRRFCWTSPENQPTGQPALAEFGRNAQPDGLPAG